MKKCSLIIGSVLVTVFIMGCAPARQLPEKWEIPLNAAEKAKGDQTGKAIIDTKTGTDITINATGLKPGEVYTAFFINPKSKMFEGIGDKPYVLPVDKNGAVNFQGKIKKDSYLRFTKMAIYLNPDKKPVGNPLGVKAKLGALLKKKKPAEVLAGKLR